MTDQKKEPDIDDPSSPVPNTPGLPRVLLIGDSISIGYTPEVRAMLRGVANVHHPADNCRNTQLGLEDLDEWLGDGDWDVIHFNFGLHDLVCRDEDGDGTTAASGQLHTPPEQYEENMLEIVRRLKITGATLIWCSTTPIPSGAGFRRENDEIGHNAIAERIMEPNSILINDLHAYALERIADIQLPNNVHFTQVGSEELAKPVVASVRAALEQM